MANAPLKFDESNNPDDVLRQAIKTYKEAIRRPAVDLDVDFLLKTMKVVDLSSPVKVARNPVDKNHEWISGTTLYNIGKIYVDDEHRLTVKLRTDNVETTVEKMMEQILSLKKELHGLQGPIMLALSDDKKVKLTDAFSHSLVKSSWAGMPFELVLGYFENDIDVAMSAKKESSDE